MKHIDFLMEDPKALKRRMATIIRRNIMRIIERSRVHDIIQAQARTKAHTCNTTTLIGTPINELPILYQYYAYRYMYDIRELVHMLRSNYSDACCPYTKRKFNRFRKHHILRTYYRKVKSSNQFQDLILDTVDTPSYSVVEAELDRLMDEYGHFHSKDILSIHLFSLIGEYAKYERTVLCPELELSQQVFYHYINGNDRNFRLCSYKILTKIIKDADDSALTSLQLQARLRECEWTVPTDDVRTLPFSFPSPIPLIQHIPTPAPVPVPVPAPVPAPRNNDGEPPRQRVHWDPDLDLD